MPQSSPVTAYDFSFSTLKSSIIITTVMTLCIVVLYRYQLLNAFSVLPGDRFDGVISTSILEHWLNVFYGYDKWSEVNYFFPYKNTIAQTDAYFLIGLCYIPFRLCGFDPFISAELAAIAIKAIGFLSAYFFSRRVFRFSFWFALLIAILFTLSNGMTTHSSRIQLSTVAFAPLLALLIVESIRGFLYDKKRQILLHGVMAGILFSAWCLTCFYMAWFFLFFFCFFCPVFLLLSKPDFRRTLYVKFRKHFHLLLVIALAGLIALLPFLSVYIPKSKEVGMRSFESVSTFLLPPEGILEVGRSNILLGDLYSKIVTFISPQYTLAHEYSNTGFTIPLFFLFIAGIAQIFRQKETTLAVAWRALALTSLLSLLLSLKFYDHSAWYFVYHLFPGAKALNVVAAFQIFLALPIILIAIRYLSKVQINTKWTQMLAVLLIAAELNVPYLNLHRNEELDRIATPVPPPSTCRVFYVSTWINQDQIPGFSEWINDVYPHNVTAIMLAQTVHMPTINGMASFNPPDWNFSAHGAQSYEDRVVSYAQKHSIKGLCRFELNTKQWKAAPLS